MSYEEQERRLVVDVDAASGNVRLSGELDLFTAELLAARLAPLLDADVDRVAVDMSGVAFCDSSGLNTLLILRRNLKATGRGLKIVAASEQVARLLSLTGLDELAAPRDTD